MSISTKEELQFLLHRCLELEKKFELISAWKGFVAVHSSFRKTVLRLARDSHKHKLELEKVLKKLDLEALINEIPDVTFDFDGMRDAEILQKIIEQDEMALDLYTELLDKTSPKLVVALFGGENGDFFYQTLKCIVNDEKTHVRLVKALTGNITRIL